MGRLAKLGRMSMARALPPSRRAPLPRMPALLCQGRFGLPDTGDAQNLIVASKRRVRLVLRARPTDEIFVENYRWRRDVRSRDPLGVQPVFPRFNVCKLDLHPSRDVEAIITGFHRHEMIVVLWAVLMELKVSGAELLFNRGWEERVRYRQACSRQACPQGLA